MCKMIKKVAIFSLATMLGVSSTFSIPRVEVINAQETTASYALKMTVGEKVKVSKILPSYILNNVDFTGVVMSNDREYVRYMVKKNDGIIKGLKKGKVTLSFDKKEKNVLNAEKAFCQIVVTVK